MTTNKLIEEAKELAGEFKLSEEKYTAGTVAAALYSNVGHLYTGISIDLACGIGFCAEHSAIAEMLKNRETGIHMIVATNMEKILPPCGRCRELMVQINKNNLNARVIIDEQKVVTLDSLLPYRWE